MPLLVGYGYSAMARFAEPGEVLALPEPKPPFLWRAGIMRAARRLRASATQARSAAEAAAIRAVRGKLDKDDGSIQAQQMTFIARDVLAGRAAMMEQRFGEAAAAFRAAAELQESHEFSAFSDPPGLVLSGPARSRRGPAGEGRRGGRAARGGSSAGLSREGPGGAVAACNRALVGGNGKASQEQHSRYKRKRAGGGVRRLVGFLVKLLFGLHPVQHPVGAGLSFREPADHRDDGRRTCSPGAERTRWMPIGQIDRDMVRAAIAAEDSKFCSHSGFDFKAIEDACKRNASGGRIRGGSTISQQTAKNAFLWQGGGYARKASRRGSPS